MTSAAISVENLSKRYRIGLKQKTHDTFGGALQDFVTRPLRNLRRLRGLSTFSDGDDDQGDIIWALNDVSFEVPEGQLLGIIGRNGAGKTTLLRILTRITEPTRGRAITRGRVSSLLEIGTAFHPELTGRDNVYLNGAVLGMGRKETKRKFDEIVEFSGVEKFIDTPVKRYSTGMQVRLAFAVAAHLEPEILLVDEVLAVGDHGFQQKCLGKMEEVATGGRTVLFVSHNMAAISTLCEKAIVLVDGRLSMLAPVNEAVDTYLAQFGGDTPTSMEWDFGEAPSGEHVKIHRIAVEDAEGVGKRHFSTTEPVYITIDYWVLTDGTRVNAHFHLFDERNNYICGVGNYTETRSDPVMRRGLYRSTCIIPGHFLNSGTHTIEAQLIANLSDGEVYVRDRIAFDTVDDQRIHSSYTRWGGLVKPDFNWETEKIGVVETAEMRASGTGSH